MSKIALIMPYFGCLPNYFDLWILSAKYNKTIDWYIFTDNKEMKNYPENVKVIFMTFDEVKKRCQDICNFTVCLDEYYKLCDYKPAYGLVFADYIKDYDFWGHCDPDIIWGNLRKFLTKEILNENDRIFTFGHLSLYRNNERINNLFKYSEKDIFNNKYICTYEDAFTTPYSCHFDEWGGISKYLELIGVKQYDGREFADIDATRFAFYCNEINDKYGAVFSWDKGNLEAYFIRNDKFESKEYAYIHLQKRSMDICLKDINEEAFLIVPNKFIEYSKPLKEDIEKYGKDKIYLEWYSKRGRMILENIKKGAIQRRLRKILK